MNQTVFTIFGLGFLLGLRHALEPDHVVAVSTIVSSNSSIARSSLAGTLWGQGHTTSLLICGAVVLALRLSVPESFVAAAEAAVAAMLVLLGANGLWHWSRAAKLHIHFHTHAGQQRIDGGPLYAAVRALCGSISRPGHPALHGRQEWLAASVDSELFRSCGAGSNESPGGNV